MNLSDCTLVAPTTKTTDFILLMGALWCRGEKSLNSAPFLRTISPENEPFHYYFCEGHGVVEPQKLYEKEEKGR